MLALSLKYSEPWHAWVSGVSSLNIRRASDKGCLATVAQDVEQVAANLKVSDLIPGFPGLRQCILGQDTKPQIAPDGYSLVCVYVCVCVCVCVWGRERMAEQRNVVRCFG